MGSRYWMPLWVAPFIGCVAPYAPPRLPPDDGRAHALIASGALRLPFGDMARHAWFAVKDPETDDWERFEVFRNRSADGTYVHRRHGIPLRGVGGGHVRVHGRLAGEPADAFIACLRRESPRYEHRDIYVVWPGPNSNTYVDVLMRECDFPAELPATAIGKDFRGWVAGASVTRWGTGVQVETPLIGFAIGWYIGIEIHVLGLTFGIQWASPALKVPVAEGRVGCDAQ